MANVDIESQQNEKLPYISSQMPLEGDEDDYENIGSSQNSGATTAVGTPDTLSCASSIKDGAEIEVVSIKGKESLAPVSSPIPEQKGNKVTRYLRHEIFSSYKKSFAVIFAANMAVLLALCLKNKGSPALEDVGAASSANLMVAILFRQENFVNLCYEIFTCVPHSFPLWIRRRLAKVFHYGGFHSGCGVAAVFWFILYSICATRLFIREPQSDALANMITSWILVLAFVFILGGAYPTFRVRYHDSFEAMHRFAGWTALLTFWAHNIFAARVAARQQGTSVGTVFLHSSNFWCIVISTSCTLLSWSRLRLRAVTAEVLSSHATRLHFRYKAMAPFYGVKVSSKPLTEWHAFATIPEEDGFSVVVSRAGDWTKHHIENPPQKLWVRGYPLHGLLYTSRLFKRIVVVATGSGIGPCLSLMAANVTPHRVLWSTRDPEATYGRKVLDAVVRADPSANVWNTTEKGYPDMVAETWKLVQESDAEAVFIISNPKLTQRVVYGMQTRGIPAYGAIFDS